MSLLKEMPRERKPYAWKVQLVAGDAIRSKPVAKKLIRPSARAQSWAEGRNIMTQQLRREVRLIEDHPEPLQYWFDDRSRETRPDAKVWLRDDSIEIHEIKFKTKRFDLELERRLEAIALAYEELGITYRWYFSDEFEAQPRRRNLDLVFRYCDYPGAADRFLESATAAVQARPGLAFRELSRATGIDMPSFLALVYDNHLGIDLDVRIDDDIGVWP